MIICINVTIIVFYIIDWSWLVLHMFFVCFDCLRPGQQFIHVWVEQILRGWSDLLSDHTDFTKHPCMHTCLAI